MLERVLERKKSLSLNEKCWRGFWREKKVYLSMKNAGEGFGERKKVQRMDH